MPVDAGRPRPPVRADHVGRVQLVVLRRRAVADLVGVQRRAEAGCQRVGRVALPQVPHAGRGLALVPAEDDHALLDQGLLQLRLQLLAHRVRDVQVLDVRAVEVDGALPQAEDVGRGDLGRDLVLLQRPGLDSHVATHVPVAPGDPGV